jgi:hypothetical protein
MDWQESSVKNQWMPFRSQISNALRALISLQNSDGGIPATTPSKESGCWTSASTLDAILTSGVYSRFDMASILRLVKFLLDSQKGASQIKVARAKKEIGEEHGSWALFKGDEPSTMATGHAIAALVLAHNFLNHDNSLSQRIEQSIKAGFAWLEINQNPDGSWGTQPLADQSGKDGNVMACYYALLPYFYSGQTRTSSQIVKKAIQFIADIQLPDGSWPPDIRETVGNPADTARAISCLVRGNYDGKICLKKATDYINLNQLKSGLWALGTKRVDLPNAPGTVIFNNNTNCDVLNAFADLKYTGPESWKLMDWLLRSQSDDGLWLLKSPDQVVKDVSTWSTSEWVISINAASEKLIRHKLYANNKRLTIAFWLTIAVLILTIISGVIVLFGNEIMIWWNGLSTTFKTLVLLPIVVGIASSFFWNMIQDIWRRFKYWGYQLLENIVNKNQDNHE